MLKIVKSTLSIFLFIYIPDRIERESNKLKFKTYTELVKLFISRQNCWYDWIKMT